MKSILYKSASKLVHLELVSDAFRRVDRPGRASPDFGVSRGAFTCLGLTLYHASSFGELPHMTDNNAATFMIKT